MENARLSVINPYDGVVMMAGHIWVLIKRGGAVRLVKQLALR
jgi:hypothetical protein